MLLEALAISEEEIVLFWRLFWFMCLMPARCATWAVLNDGLLRAVYAFHLHVLACFVTPRAVLEVRRL